MKWPISPADSDHICIYLNIRKREIWLVYRSISPYLHQSPHVSRESLYNMLSYSVITGPDTDVYNSEQLSGDRQTKLTYFSCLCSSIPDYRSMYYSYVEPFNSLWPSDAIWRQGSGSTLAQVMACCLTAPSHCLNQCWLILIEVLWTSIHLRVHFSEYAQDISTWYEFEDY